MLLALIRRMMLKLTNMSDLKDDQFDMHMTGLTALIDGCLQLMRLV